jgi:N,N'-diacetylbacillosaminyl-diphospho-undecaprenol alpha-1,3-N-acetylgalactosaminyltransferase
MPVMRALREWGAQVWAISRRGLQPALSGAWDRIRAPLAGPQTFHPLKAWATVHRLRSILRALRPDVLHTFTLRPNVYGALAGWLAGVPAIVSTVTGLGTLYTRHDVRTRLLRWGLNRSPAWPCGRPTR